MNDERSALISNTIHQQLFNDSVLVINIQSRFF